jgi:phosphotransferase system HPr (HPr) family protein
MTPESHVATRKVEITNTNGLHLRPADKFVRLANQFKSEVRINYKGKQFNGKSILEVATLAADCGTWLELEARGSDAEAAVVALAELVLARFHEAEEGQDASQAEKPAAYQAENQVKDPAS